LCEELCHVPTEDLLEKDIAQYVGMPGELPKVIGYG